MIEEVAEGWVDPAIHREFPDLLLLETTVDARPGRSPKPLRAQLRTLSERWFGAKAVAVRGQPVPQAYRVFFRQIGLDPDETRTPMEEVVLDRLMHGDFRSRGLVDDAVTLAVVETGVPVAVLDDAGLDGPLGLRAAVHGERFGSGELHDELVGGRLVVADASGVVAVLFERIAPQHVVRSETSRMRLFAVRVPGVPPVHAEEALWLCAEALAGDA